MARDGIEQNRSADALQRPLFRISQAVAHLHLDRYTELGAFRVDRVIACVIWRHFEPVRIEVCTNKPELADRIFKARQTLHSLGWIDASKPAEPRRMLLHHCGDALITDVAVYLVHGAPCLYGDQKRMLDAGTIHFFDECL